MCASGWLRMGDTIIEVLHWMGSSGEKFSLDCRHEGNEYRIQCFSRERLAELHQKDVEHASTNLGATSSK